MKDGSCILASLSYRSTLPRRLAVASEVSILDFIRAQGIPTSLAFGYSIGDNNATDTECILLEKLPGKPTGDTWFDLGEQKRLKVLLQIVNLEAKLFTINSPASGSIYYAHDQTPSTLKVGIPGFESELCVGPFAALRWWFGERGDLDIYGGPRK